MRLKLGFGNQCLLALVFGLIIGHYLPTSVVNTYISPFGKAFLKLLQLIIVPLTFSTIVASFSKLENISMVKQLGFKTIFWFILTALIASSIGVIVGVVIAPGTNLIQNSLSGYTPRTIPSISETLIDMLPGNLIQEVANGKIIPIILFAIFFGIALTSLHEKGNTVKAFFSEFSETMFKITRVIIRMSPIGIFALIAEVGNSYGIETLIPLAKFIIAIYLACILQLIVYGILITVFAKKNPFKFFKEFYPAMVTAFTTSSSLGTLPVTLETLVDRVKVKKQVAGFVAPLGATMKMDGCGAIYPAIVCVLTANLFHIPLSLQHYLIIIITASIATIGTAGVPGTASIMATLVLTSVGLPLNGLAMIIGIDKIIDMMRTTTNVTGSGTVSVLVNKDFELK